MSIENKTFVVEMPNGEKWGVPVSFIAKHRTDYYFSRGDEFETFEDAYADTVDMFSDEYEIEDWAKNNMNWSDVKDRASLRESIPCDWQEGWMNGNCEIV